MDNQVLESQAKKYANELNTFAYEYGFTSEESWCLVPTNEAKKIEIEKKFYPTLSIPVQPELSGEFRNMVLSKIKHIKNDGQEETPVAVSGSKNALYLTAYNSNRKA